MKFCTLFSGSSGNCIYIEAGGAKFLLDAGKNAKTISLALRQIDVEIKDIDGIFLTHEHSDHVSAVPVLAGRFGMPIYGRVGTLSGVVDKYGLMPDRFTMLSGDGVYNICGIEVRAFRTPHDTPDSTGFSFTTDDGKKLAVATDIGEFSGEVEQNLLGAHFIVLESNHDIEMLKTGPYPYHLKQRVLSKRGHLSNDDCASAVCTLVGNGTEHFVLAHLSAMNNTERHALNATCGRLIEIGVQPGEVTVDIAPRDTIGRLIEF